MPLCFRFCCCSSGWLWKMSAIYSVRATTTLVDWLLSLLPGVAVSGTGSKVTPAKLGLNFASPPGAHLVQGNTNLPYLLDLRGRRAPSDWPIFPTSTVCAAAKQPVCSPVRVLTWVVCGACRAHTHTHCFLYSTLVSVADLQYSSSTVVVVVPAAYAPQRIQSGTKLHRGRMH